jgi:hypothetical protein
VSQDRKIRKVVPLNKYDLLGGFLIVLSIAFGIAEYLYKGGDVVIFDFYPYAVWMVIGLVISYEGDE